MGQAQQRQRVVLAGLHMVGDVVARLPTVNC